MERNKIVTVKNRSAGMVVYSIPEDNIRREFAAGEEKRITWGELEKLSYLAGGRTMLDQYLQVKDEKAIDELNINVVPEYHMTEAQIKDLLTTGSMDELLDCLDYAPRGVLDLLKKIAVDLPVQNVEKRAAIKEKLGFDCDAAIRHVEEEKFAAKQEGAATKTVSAQRRTSGSKYKVVG